METERTILAEEQLAEAPAVKVCSCCGRTLPLDAFKHHNQAKDGYTFVCKECTRANYGKGKSPKSVTEGNPKLAGVTPQELIDELKFRGYKGRLTYSYTITKEISL